MSISGDSAVVFFPGPKGSCFLRDTPIQGPGWVSRLFTRQCILLSLAASSWQMEL